MWCSHTRAGKEIYAHKRTHTYSHINNNVKWTKNKNIKKNLAGGGGWDRTYTYIRWFITNLQEAPWVDAKINKVLLVSSAYWPCWYRRISMWKERGEIHKLIQSTQYVLVNVIAVLLSFNAISTWISVWKALEGSFFFIVFIVPTTN